MAPAVDRRAPRWQPRAIYWDAMTRPKRRTKKIDPVKEAEIVRDLVEHEKTQVEIAQAAEVSRRSVQRIKESHRDEIEAHQKEVQLRTLRHLDETLDAQNKALAADVLAEGSRTKPQSYRVQLEGAGVIGGKGGHAVLTLRGCRAEVTDRSLRR